MVKRDELIYFVAIRATGSMFFSAETGAWNMEPGAKHCAAERLGADSTWS